METLQKTQVIAFAGPKRIASGDLEHVAAATKLVVDSNERAPILIFDDLSDLVEIDFRGTVDDVIERIKEQQSASASASAKQSTGTGAAKSVPQGVGRPKLGVVAREVTLLPRHWDWLSSQPGGASVTLRKLVEAAQRAGGNDRGGTGSDRVRTTREVTYKFMHAIAGDLPGFEEATRALFAGNRDGFVARIESWPEDIRTHVEALAAESFK